MIVGQDAKKNTRKTLEGCASRVIYGRGGWGWQLTNILVPTTFWLLRNSYQPFTDESFLPFVFQSFGSSGLAFIGETLK